MAKKSGSAQPTAQVLSSETIYQGPVFGLRRDELIEPTGLRTKREVITHPGSVVVLPVLPVSFTDGLVDARRPGEGAYRTMRRLACRLG